MAKTDLQIQQEALANLEKKKKAGAKGVAAGQAYIGSLGGLHSQTLQASQKSGQQGIRDVRLAGAEALSKAVGGAPRTGLGARLAAGRGIAKQTGQQVASARDSQADKEAQMRMQQAEQMNQATQNQSKLEQGQLDIDQEILAQEKEIGDMGDKDKLLRQTNAINEINNSLGQYEDQYWGMNDDEAGAEAMIRNVAEKYKLDDPELYTRLLKLAEKIGNSSYEIGGGFVVTPQHVDETMYGYVEKTV